VTDWLWLITLTTTVSTVIFAGLFVLEVVERPILYSARHLKGTHRPRGTYLDELDRVMSENRRRLRRHPAPWGPNPIRHKQ
jgi:hypothetical protein